MPSSSDVPTCTVAYVIFRALLIRGGGVSNQLLLTNLFDEFDFVQIPFGYPVRAVGLFSEPPVGP